MANAKPGRRKVVCKVMNGKDIDSLGYLHPDGLYQRLDVGNIITKIEKKEGWEFYTVKNGKEAKVEVVKRTNGTKYLRSKADDTTADNLDSLPNC